MKKKIDEISGGHVKAVTIEKFGSVQEMQWTDLPTPIPLDNEVQIQITYASVNPVDWKICNGSLQTLFKCEFPLIPGWDAAGLVSSVGKNVTKFKLGDEVYTYCRKPIVQWGTYAEYVCCEESHVALKPKKLNFAQAASIPLVGLTAWQALFDQAKIIEDQSVLIHAGAGGVGGIGIELARAVGARIYTTASLRNHPYVKSLGANVVIDYHKDDFVQQILQMEEGGVDVVLDCVGGDTLARSYGVVKPGGHLITIVDAIDKEKADEKGIQAISLLVRPNGSQLEQIGQWFDEAKIKIPYIKELPLMDYAQAIKLSEAGHTKGKIVLRVAK